MPTRRSATRRRRRRSRPCRRTPSRRQLYHRGPRFPLRLLLPPPAPHRVLLRLLLRPVPILLLLAPRARHRIPWYKQDISQGSNKDVLEVLGTTGHGRRLRRLLGAPTLAMGEHSLQSIPSQRQDSAERLRRHQRRHARARRRRTTRSTARISSAASRARSSSSDYFRTSLAMHVPLMALESMLLTIKMIIPVVKP